MILIAYGANLDSPAGPPRQTFAAAETELIQRGISPIRQSGLYETEPVPPSGQPMYLNRVTAVETALTPEELLRDLLDVESLFGRERGGERNAPRSLDLDVVAYGHLVQDGPPALPHPRMADRAFVLRPLMDIAPDWVHPVLKLPVSALLQRLDHPEIQAKRVED